MFFVSVCTMWYCGRQHAVLVSCMTSVRAAVTIHSRRPCINWVDTHPAAAVDDNDVDDDVDVRDVPIYNERYRYETPW